MLTALMYHQPEEPLDYLENCLKKVREIGGLEKVRWDTFILQERRALPPVGGSQGRRAVYRSALSESHNLSHCRYDRLPPIHQFSIESDTDLSETDELIEEYVVFDPSKPRPRIILVIGGPASGKGTQSMKIAKHYGFNHISVGELLREKMLHNASNNRKWGLIAKIITNGELAPQETTIMEIKQQLMQNPDSQGFVIDGFPREVSQAICFDDQICVPDLVIYLACANDRLRERLEKRAVEGRPDNNPKAIHRRLTTFKQNIVPLAQYYEEKCLIVTLNILVAVALIGGVTFVIAVVHYIHQSPYPTILSQLAGQAERSHSRFLGLFLRDSKVLRGYVSLVQQEDVAQCFTTIDV
ncbi:adenylate kinase isoenzyme 5-like [Scyliorhinus canicula]|uniref:adenylate kinase isoenzyme 5-like n=1 Tax=Scyliorhinus canicula TaxID=7830 RepID=UPI0018F2CE24|nr:adenylate kinase isoenzyme 5-like [Scyliorhinus canicula]